ncbi:MAG: hypothetical protein HY514_03675 [Candidatus Aenigmarchaeota archaeon]|nr:hypothetical protein [Candidatus Aenigmarchaeota archaeon]
MFARFQMDKLVEIYGSAGDAERVFRQFCGEMKGLEHEIRKTTGNTAEFLADLFYKASVPAYARGEMPLMMFTPVQESELLQRFGGRKNLMASYRQFVESRNGARLGEHLGQLFYGSAMADTWEEVG